MSGCNSVLGIGEFTAKGNCERNGELRCNEQRLALEVCSENGEWKEKEKCTNKTCEPPTLKCVGECAPGQTHCSGNTNIPQTCGKTGKWEDVATGACVNQTCDPDTGACIGLCEPGQKNCSDNNAPQDCDGKGQWKDVSGPCVNKTCNPATLACVGECAKGSKRCGGETPQVCDGTGTWKPSVSPCGVGTHCAGGACVVECTPGDLRCFGDVSQKCDPSGNWKDTGPPCGTPCGGSCNEATGTCIPMDGTSCDDGDVCTGSSVCQSGSCTSSQSSDHHWAHWDLKAPSPSPRYTWTGGDESTKDDVVYDKVTHLVWQRKSPLSSYAWEDAKNYCKCLNGESTPVSCEVDKIPRYPSGWRLPTRIELATIVDYNRLSPSINTAAFPSTPSGAFWSSSSFAGNPSSAWLVYFDYGSVGSDYVAGAFRVRCVR